MIPYWLEIEIYAEVGTQFGVVRSEEGKLTLITKAPLEISWPHGKEPIKASVNMIVPGKTRYVVWIEPRHKTETR